MVFPWIHLLVDQDNSIKQSRHDDVAPSPGAGNLSQKKYNSKLWSFSLLKRIIDLFCISPYPIASETRAETNSPSSKNKGAPDNVTGADNGQLCALYHTSLYACSIVSLISRLRYSPIAISFTVMLLDVIILMLQYLIYSKLIFLGCIPIDLPLLSLISSRKTMYVFSTISMTLHCFQVLLTEYDNKRFLFAVDTKEQGTSRKKSDINRSKTYSGSKFRSIIFAW